MKSYKVLFGLLLKLNKNMPKKGERKQFCPKGHDTFICGRGGKSSCKDCKKEYDRGPKLSLLKKQFCPHGHDTFVVGRVKSSGKCKECARIGKAKNYPKIRDQAIAYGKQYHKTHKKERRNFDLLRRFGITLNDYNEMLKEQNYACAGCLRPQTDFTKSLAVDHDHKTGKVRGLLCPTCNRLLGQISERQDVLSRLIKYLEKYN